MGRISLALIGVTVLVALLWIGGEQHRGNCIDQGRASCSILPWGSGHSAPQQTLTPQELREAERLLRQQQP